MLNISQYISMYGLEVRKTSKGTNNRTTIHVEGDLKVHKCFVLGLLIFRPHYTQTFLLNNYTENTMRSVTVK